MTKHCSFRRPYRPPRRDIDTAVVDNDKAKVVVRASHFLTKRSYISKILTVAQSYAPRDIFEFATRAKKSATNVSRQENWRPLCLLYGLSIRAQHQTLIQLIRRVRKKSFCHTVQLVCPLLLTRNRNDFSSSQNFSKTLSMEQFLPSSRILLFVDAAGEDGSRRPLPLVVASSFYR